MPLIHAAVQQNPGRAFRAGWITGTLTYVGLLYWIVVTFEAADQSPLLAIPCLLLLAAYLALFWGAWAYWLSWSAVRMREGGISFPLAGACAWAVLEFLRTHLFSGFPWTLLGDSQITYLPMIQIASYTGVYGVSFLIAWVNLSLASTLWKRNMTPLIVALAVGANFYWGKKQMDRLEAQQKAPSFKIALLQGNIDQYKKWDAVYVSDIKRTYEKLNVQAKQQKPQLIIWPETSVPGFLLEEPSLRKWLDSLIQRTGVHQLVGAPSKAGENDAYNTAYSLTAQSKVVSHYSKKHLVPFGEVVPFAEVLSRWVSVLNRLGGFQPGKESSVLATPIGPIGVNICYEAIFPELVRQSVLAGAEFIVNMTNDGWYMQTAAPYQHFAPNIFRAVENRRWLMRANNTGISAIVSPIGRVTAESSIFVPAVVSGSVSPSSEKTFYTLKGDVFAWGCLALCVLLPLGGILRRS